MRHALLTLLTLMWLLSFYVMNWPAFAAEVLRHGTPCEVKVGPFGATNRRGEWEPAEGLADAMKVVVSINGGALLPRCASAEIVYDGYGFYAIPLDANDTGEFGRLDVVVIAAGHPPMRASCEVLNENQ